MGNSVTYDTVMLTVEQLLVHDLIVHASHCYRYTTPYISENHQLLHSCTKNRVKGLQ